MVADPLLRELLARAAQWPALYPDGGLEEHLFTILIDEIAAAPIGELHLPMPTDSRLREIVSTMLADPAGSGSMASWAERAGMSERTFARRLSRETGMSFSRWRQRINVMLALQWLAEGWSIQQVSAGLGYESASSFVTQFRKVLWRAAWTLHGRAIQRFQLRRPAHVLFCSDAGKFAAWAKQVARSSASTWTPSMGRSRGCGRQWSRACGSWSLKLSNFKYIVKSTKSMPKYEHI